MMANAEQKKQIIQMFNDGIWAEAERLARQMVSIHPEDAFGWKALGIVLKNSGRASEAVPLMETAVRMTPEDAEAHYNLGIALAEIGRFHDAEIRFRTAISIRQDYADAYYRLANVLAAREDYDGAASFYGKSISLRPDYAGAHNNLGNILYYQGKLDDAVTSYCNAIACKNDDADPYNNQGNVLRILGRLDEAERCCLKSIELRPDFAEAHNNLGNIYKDSGRIQEAIRSYQIALSFKNDLLECHKNLCDIKKFTRDDPQIPILRRLYSETKTTSDKSKISFALGKAMEDLREYDESFAFYQEGNQLRKAELGYSIEQDRKLFGMIKASFVNWLPQTDPVAMTEVKPILIVGMPRSGTTLVEQILASHSEVRGAGELEVLNRQAASHFNDEPNFDLDNASRAIAKGYVGEMERFAEGCRYVTDKMPINFRWLGFLLLVNPEIRVVHTMRDPVATCWSIFRQYFPAKGLGFSWDLEDLGTYYRMYEDLMSFWHEKFPGRIYDLNYECLTESQEAETRKLLEYCGLPWDDRCLEFEKTDRPVRTASSAQVRQKMYKGSSEAWRPYEPYLGPLMKALGRTVDPGAAG